MTTTQQETTATPTTDVTPYQAAKLVNEWLAGDGIEKVIPPQMMYNYTAARLNKGKAPLITGAKRDLDTGKVTVKVEDLKSWYTGYAAKARALQGL